MFDTMITEGNGRGTRYGDKNIRRNSTYLMHVLGMDGWMVERTDRRTGGWIESKRKREKERWKEKNKKRKKSDSRTRAARRRRCVREWRRDAGRRRASLAFVERRERTRTMASLGASQSGYERPPTRERRPTSLVSISARRCVSLRRPSMLF